MFLDEWLGVWSDGWYHCRAPQQLNWLGLWVALWEERDTAAGPRTINRISSAHSVDKGLPFQEQQKWKCRMHDMVGEWQMAEARVEEGRVSKCSGGEHRL